MKVGIYFPDFKPEDGGANTLLGTILKEIEKEKSSKYDFIVFYKGKTNKVNYKNGIKYIDLGYLFGTNFTSKAIRRIREIVFSYSILDIIAKKEKIDLYYFPEHPNINVSIPYIYTVWDLGHRTAPEYKEVSANGVWEKREQTYQKMLYKAEYIITGNNTGKEEIIKYYGINENRIKICEFPVSNFCYGNEIKPSYNLVDNYFFYPAQFWSHKNHICIVEAIKLLKEEYGIKAVVYFTGSDKGNKEYIENKVNEYCLNEQVKFTGFIKDEELKYMYTHTIAMIFASMIGPNNIPPIEATFLNCPVIITNLKGHKEQLGDTALYFDGNNPKELALLMKKMLEDKEYRNSIIESQKSLAKELANINYFDNVKKILDEYYNKNV